MSKKTEESSQEAWGFSRSERGRRGPARCAVQKQVLTCFPFFFL